MRTPAAVPLRTRSMVVLLPLLLSALLAPALASAVTIPPEVLQPAPAEPDGTGGVLVDPAQSGNTQVGNVGSRGLPLSLLEAGSRGPPLSLLEAGSRGLPLSLLEAGSRGLPLSLLEAGSRGLPLSLGSRDVPESVGVLAVDPARVPFGAVTVGDRVERTVVASNDGGAELTLDAPVLEGGGDVTASADCEGGDLVLGPGESCAITVRYEPSSVATLDALLVVASDAPDGVRRVPLLGRGVRVSVARIVPDPVDVGQVDVGGDTSVFVTVFNDGGRVLAIERVRIAGSADVAVDDGCDGVRVPVGQACAVRLVFAPESAATLDDVELVVSSNDPAGDRTAPVTGAGVAGPGGGPDVAPPAGPRATATPEPGGGPDVAPPAEPRATATPEPLGDDDVAPPAEPRATATPEPLGDDDVAPPPLRPPAPAPDGATLVVGADAIDFGEVAFSTSVERAVVVRNVDDAPALIHGVDLRMERGGFVLTRDTCARELLPPEASCEVAVRFSPTTDVAFRGDLVVAADVGDPPSVTLQGIGVPTADPEPVPPVPDAEPDAPASEGPPRSDQGGNTTEPAATPPGGADPDIGDHTPTSYRPDPEVVIAALVLAALVGTLPLTVPYEGPRWLRRHVSARLRPTVASRRSAGGRGTQARLRPAPRRGPSDRWIDEETQP